MKLKFIVLTFFIIYATSSLKTNAQQETFIGEVKMFAGTFAPRGWAFCEGQMLLISQNSALFSLLGTTYGGDGTTTFALPDLRGRAPIHKGNGPGLSNYNLGQKGGLETVTLNVSQIPSHHHDGSTLNGVMRANEEDVDSDEAVNRSLGTSSNNLFNSFPPDTDMISGSIKINGNTGNKGGSQYHENRAPFLVINYIIALQGVYPSSN